MLPFKLFLNFRVTRRSLPLWNKNTKFSTVSSDSDSTSSSSSSSSSSDEDEKIGDKSKSKVASNKLNDLLQEMIKHDLSKHDSPKAANLQMNKILPKFRKKITEKDEIASAFKRLGLEKDIIEAAKDVSSKLDGDKKETQINLLEKATEIKHDKEIIEQVKDPVESLAASQKSYIDLRDLIKNMKVEDKADVKPSRSEQVRQILGHHNIKMSKSRSKSVERRATLQVDKLNDGVVLNIFENVKVKSVDDTIDLWDNLNTREMNLSVVHPPSNYFEEMILWTNQQKFWKFPIDNEIGLENEKSISFADHIFLENYIKEWCPKQGPIRHFMEIVCVGLSKNPYLTVKRKRAHLDWYKEYFLNKKDIIHEIGLKI